MHLFNIFVNKILPSD